MDFLNSCRNDLELRCLFELLQKVFQKCDPTTLYCKPFRQTHHPLTRGYEDVFEKQKGIVLTEALYDRILLEHASSPQKHILYTSTILRGIKSPHTACFSTNFIEAIKNNNFDTFCELIKGNQYLGFIEDPEDPRYGFYESSTNPTEPYLMRRQEEVISRGAVPKIPPDYDSIEMGDLDPSSLTAEDFQNLPGTLWLHVNLKINYQPDIHTLDKQGESIVEGFLGEGLYLRSTPPPGKKTHEPYRLSRSRLLDLRLKNHQNPGLPLDVVERWEIFFNQHSSQLIEQPFHSRAVNHYREYLKNIKLYELTSLQDILRSHNGLSPLWVGLFSEFMRSEGFEGIVYDGPSGEEYALFNLEKAGPYDYWQRQRRKA
ncbi:MAG: hypothetical protein IPJ69_10840 [Deltaproteobacteria bacterium]|nr:MAG: hypothetical protein IPJ69_10840 [Deltaproteobacteria bacterium]